MSRTYTTGILYVLARHAAAMCSFFEGQNNRHPIEKLLETKNASILVVAVLTTLAFALRFYKINQPDQVVCVGAPRCVTSLLMLL
jgi:hypothetical protein